MQRLRHLERMGVVDLWPSPTGRGNEYHLTPAGKDLEAVVMALGRWAVQWLFDDLRPHEVDPVNLLWWMHRRIDEHPAPAARVVVEFVHTEPTRTTIWMVLDRGEASVCLQHPGFDSDLRRDHHHAGAGRGVLRGSTPGPTRSLSGAIRIDGPPALARRLPKWFLGSPFADVTRAMVSARG